MPDETPYIALRPTEEDALRAWEELIVAEGEQVGRVREPEPDADFYAPVAGRFRPGVRESVELPALLELAEPDDTWMDIGAGGGRLTIPLAQQVKRMIAVDPSEAMRQTMTEAAGEAGCTNLELRDARWPVPDWDEDLDVSLAAHAVYDIRDIGGFLDAMEQHSRRLCVAVLGDLSRGAQYARLFQELHGEPYISLPAAREFTTLLGARGRRYEVRTAGRYEPTTRAEPEEAYAMVRRMMWLSPDSEKDRRMRELLHEWYGMPDGNLALPAARNYIAVISWEPPGR